MGLSLLRSVGFTARHRLAFPDRTVTENHARFGALAEEHEHRYTCRVAVLGPPGPGTGMVMDLALLDRILAEEVVAPLDGADLNRALDLVRRGEALPVCEVLAREIFERIAPRLPVGTTLDLVRVEEAPDLAAEYRRG